MHMTNIILCGACGRMGRAIAQFAPDYGCYIVAGADVRQDKADFPLYEHIDMINIKADVIVDFSHHTSAYEIARYASARKIPVVVATTGHDEAEQAAISALSKEVAVFQSRNMSLGVNLLINLCKSAASILGGKYDIEIIEKHHNKKIDSPSGTALMIAEELKEIRPDSEIIYGRPMEMHQREKGDIAIHAVRGGSIVGEHEVMFCGENDSITLTHSASSRELFAEGALRAAVFAANKKSGYYTMKSFLEENIGSHEEKKEKKKVALK